jgi:hypothetical protein
MATRTNARKTTAKRADSDYPRYWDWEADGRRIEGTFVEFGEGVSREEWRMFALLEIDNVDGEPREKEQRTIWFHHEALSSKFFERIRRLGAIEPGERIVIERAEEKVLSGNGYEYFPYRVEFPDAPGLSQEALVERYMPESKGQSREEPGKAEADGAPEDDGIPF